MLGCILEWIRYNSDEIVIGVVIFIAGTAIVGAGVLVVKSILKVAQNKFVWKLSTPLTNSNTRPIDKYPPDYNAKVAGVEALKQSIRQYVLTEPGKYIIYPRSYGAEEALSIFTIKYKEEFQRQAENLATRIMSEFKEWIERLYSVSRKGHTLIIDIKVNGIAVTQQCDIHYIISETSDRSSFINDICIIGEGDASSAYYTVKEGDTSLHDIVYRFGRESGDLKELYELNCEILHVRSNRELLYPGLKLKIPDKWMREWYGN